MNSFRGFLSQSQALSGTNAVSLSKRDITTSGPPQPRPSLPTVRISPLDFSPLFFKVLQRSFCCNASHGRGFLHRSLPLNVVHFPASVLMLWLSPSPRSLPTLTYFSYVPGTCTKRVTHACCPIQPLQEARDPSPVILPISRIKTSGPPKRSGDACRLGSRSGRSRTLLPALLPSYS